MEELSYINYPIIHIKKLTHYLSDIKNPEGKRVHPKIIAFCWYYVHNGNNKSDAYRRAYCSNFNPKTRKMECEYKDESKEEITRRNFICATNAYDLFMLPYVRKIVNRIERRYMKEIKKYLPQSMLEQLVIQATYDPSMFFTPEGKVAFDDWEAIPAKYRCCVEGIEQKAYGKDADVTITTIKLVDREKARKYLLKMCPGLLEAEKLEVVHKTIDKDGNEIGIDYTKLSDEELLRKYSELKEQ
jgi:hypothetical protein